MFVIDINAVIYYNSNTGVIFMLSQKISRLMELVGAENSDIAINADFDQSNVSRLRSGARIPEKRSTSINKFANGLIIFSKQIGK
jgi:hypothetical protein